MEPQLLERINGHFGYRAIERISMIHAPPKKKPPPARRQSGNNALAPDPEARAAIETALAAVDDPEIRAVLARLGRAVISDTQGGGEE